MLKVEGVTAVALVFGASIRDWGVRNALVTQWELTMRIATTQVANVAVNQESGD